MTARDECDTLATRTGAATGNRSAIKDINIAPNLVVENLHKEMSIGAFSELSPFNLDHVAWLEEGMVGLTER